MTLSLFMHNIVGLLITSISLQLIWKKILISLWTPILNLESTSKVSPEPDTFQMNVFNASTLRMLTIDLNLTIHFNKTYLQWNICVLKENTHRYDVMCNIISLHRLVFINHKFQDFLWWRANTQNVSFHILYGGQFILPYYTLYS